MTLRIAALLLAFAAASSWAQTAPPAAAERAAILKSLERGKEIRGGQGQYRHMPQVLAVARARPSESPEQAIARTGERGAQLIETKGRLVLFSTARLAPASVAGAGSAAVFPTVINARSGALGVLTGTLIVKPTVLSDADAIASGYGLEKTRVYPELKTVFYRAKAGIDIADVAAALQADPRVDDAYPEIIEQVLVPR